MTDRVPGAPGRYSAVITAAELLKMQDGENFNITLTRNDDPVTEGTPYSKAAVLPDELAAALCPDIQDPAPADALSALLPKTAAAAKVAHALTIKNSAGTALATFDGSATKSVTLDKDAVGLGKNLTIKNSAGVAQVEYDGSEAKALTLSKAMVGLANAQNTTDGAKDVASAQKLRPLISDWSAEISGHRVAVVQDASGVYNILESSGGTVKVAQAGMANQLLNTLKGVPYSVLAMGTAVVTSNAYGTFTILTTGSTCAALGNCGSNDDSGTKHGISFASPSAGYVAGRVWEASTGNQLANYTFRVNYVVFNI